MAEPLWAQMAHAPNITPVMQRRAFDWALRAKNWKTIGILAHNQNLTDEIDDLIGALRQAQPRIAWLTRPGRSPEQVAAALEGEDRGTVLVTLARLVTDSSTLARVLDAAEASTRTTPLETALTVAENPASAGDLRRRAMRAVGEHLTFTRTLIERTEKLLDKTDGDPTLRVDLLSGDATLSAHLVKADGPLDQVVVERTSECLADYLDLWFERVTDTEHRHASWLFEHDEPLHTALKRVIHLSTDSAMPVRARRRIAEVLFTARDADVRHRMGVQKALDGTLEAFLHRGIETREDLEHSLTLLEEATTSTDPDRLAEIAAMRFRLGQPLEACLKSNPALPLEILARFHWYGVTSIDRLTRVRDDVWELLRHPDFAVGGLGVVSDDDLERFGIAEEYLVSAAAHASYFPAWVANSRHLTERVVRAAPVNGLRRCMYLTTAKMLVTVLDEAFGDNSELWELYESMADSFGGSLDELIGCVTCAISE